MADNAELSASLFNCNGCPITSLADQAYGEVLNFYYNKKGNPDSVSWVTSGIYSKFVYDRWNRLSQINFGIPSVSIFCWFSFKYRGFDPLPIAYDFIYPAFGGLQAIDSFQYDFLGRITHRFGTFINNPVNNYDEHYTYDWKGNVVKTDVKGHDGGTGYNPGFLEFTASTYDNKPNIMGGNPWFKYLFFYSFVDATPFYYSIFSQNNAQNYNWYYDIAGDSYSVNSTFTYDNKGFATNDAMDFYDNVGQTDIGIFNRTALAACDVQPPAQNFAVPRTLPLMEKTKTRMQQIPSPLTLTHTSSKN
jgi:hypothetical protein